ncbi:hypothetical protein GYB22_04500 [bacterium]|nr:hypothetical protein [bacterium]
MKIKIFLILSLFFLFASCQPEEGEQTVSFENKYSLTIPSFLNKAYDLNEEASLQYQNTWKEFYVVVLDEPKEDFITAIESNYLSELYPNDIKGYSNLLLDFLKESMTITEESDLKEALINGLPARTIQITGTVEGVECFFTMAYIQGLNDYYQIMTWTLAEKKDDYSSRMMKLLHSFKELGG